MSISENLKHLYEQHLDIVFVCEEDLRTRVVKKAKRTFTSGEDGPPLLIYALPSRGRYAMDLFKDASQELAEQIGIRGPVFIDRQNPEVPTRIEGNTLYLVALQDYQPGRGCPWMKRALFISRFSEPENSTSRCILVVDGFPNPVLPPCFQFNALFEYQRLEFIHGNEKYFISLESNIYLTLAGYLPKPGDVNQDVASSGQIVRGKAMIVAVD